jgi:hypothetical protein
MPQNSQDKKSSATEVMEVEYINHERLYLSQIVLHVAKYSLDQNEDSYL